MKETYVYISYHPGSLQDYETIKELIGKKKRNILVLCSHAYVTPEIIDLYRGKFDECIYLPEIDYQTNLWAGLIEYRRFISQFRKDFLPLIEGTEKFHVFSDFSSFPSVNALLTFLKKNSKCGTMVSIMDDYVFGEKVDWLRTLRSRVYSLLLQLNPVAYYRKLGYKYDCEFRDIIIRVLDPYEKEAVPAAAIHKDIPRYYLRRKQDRKRTNPGERDLIVFFSDRQLENFSCSLSKDQFTQKLAAFFAALRKKYEGLKIICKPHPQDKGQAPEEMAEIKPELYTGTLTSQMHIEANREWIRACYSISSTSLISAASKGIPAYSIYRYLGFNGTLPGEFFENSSSAKIPYLRNISTLEDIGCIDQLEVAVEEGLEQPDIEKIISKGKIKDAEKKNNR